MVKQKIEGKYLAKFIILSCIGIFLFLIPVGGAVPVVTAVNTIKKLLGGSLIYLVEFAITLLMVTLLLGKVFHIKKFEAYHKDDPLSKKIFFVLSFVVIVCVMFKLGPAFIFQDERIGGSVMTLAGTVMLTVTLAGWLIIFMLKSGIVEFAGILLEPLMRPLFKMPGQAAVNCLSSYMVSPAVGVYMTSQYYDNKTYTRREGVTAACCFSTVSVGYIGVLCSLGGVENEYSKMVIASLILIFVMTAICVRIPPLSRMKNVYADGSDRSTAAEVPAKGDRFHTALAAATARCRDFTVQSFFGSLWNSMKFAQKIIGYMIPIVIVTLTLVHYTPVFQWLGKPLAPVLALLGLPNAAEIAPAALLGFIEVSLPAISITGLGVATQSAFFVVLLSILQIVFITEAGNAIMGSSMKVKFLDLLFVFIVRTVIAIPLCALVCHLMF